MAAPPGIESFAELKNQLLDIQDELKQLADIEDDIKATLAAIHTLGSFSIHPTVQFLRNESFHRLRHLYHLRTLLRAPSKDDGED